MRKINFNLPIRYRVEVTFSKRRRSFAAKKLFIDIKKAIGSNEGNILSRIIRTIFERRKIKQTLGANLAFIVIGTSLLTPSPSNILAGETQPTTLQAPLVLKTETGVQFPLEEIKITQGYHFWHPGIDLDGVTGDLIFPVISGEVIETGYSRFGYGNNVLINHGNGIISLYAHLSKVSVEKGDMVTNETKIGEMGATGRSFGDHLHLEIYEDGKTINPLSILPR